MHVDHPGDGNHGHGKLADLEDEIELLLIAAERQEVNELFRTGKLKDEGRRRIERERRSNRNTLDYTHSGVVFRLLAPRFHVLSAMRRPEGRQALGELPEELRRALKQIKRSRMSQSLLLARHVVRSKEGTRKER